MRSEWNAGKQSEFTNFLQGERITFLISLITEVQRHHAVILYHIPEVEWTRLWQQLHYGYDIDCYGYHLYNIIKSSLQSTVFREESKEATERTINLQAMLTWKK